MSFWEVFRNPVLASALTAWGLAQIIKLPVEVVFKRRWNWAILLSTGGMPSSHAALVSAIAIGVGLSAGFQSPLFALAAAFAIVVLYDATGIRRHAGRHAQIINQMIDDLMHGHPLKESKELKEALGHTPLEVAGGIVFGILVAVVMMRWLRY